MFCFPPSPFYCFSITLRNRKTRNCVFSLKHRMLLLPTNTQNTFKLSPGRSWITLHSQIDWLYAMHQTKPTLKGSHRAVCYSHACSPSLSRCRSLCKRWELFFVRSESQWTLLMAYLTISANVRRYQTHHRWHFFSFRKTVCNTVQLQNCCRALDFLSPEPCPQYPRAERTDYKN